ASAELPEILPSEALAIPGAAPEAAGVQSDEGTIAPSADAQFETAVDPRPVFYSQVREVVEKKGPNAATGDQWLSTISNAPGVKAEEVEWLKLPNFLKGRDGKISKADLVAHLEENQIRVDETLRDNNDNAAFPGLTKYGDYVEG